MIALRTIVFLKELLSGRLEIPFGFAIIMPDGQKVFEKPAEEDSLKHMIILKDVPGYFELEIEDAENRFLTKKTNTLEGYYLALNNFEGYVDFLRKKISPKRRYNLRKYQNRLELSFDIHYKMYFDTIAQDEYHRLFRQLQGFLRRRFAEKKEVNYEIPHLQEMEEIVYDLILDKKASLFVIYHKKQPVSIRINMFYEKLAFYIISGYDIDFSAFHVGAIDMLKNIEWCFQNGYDRYDLLKGYPEYKKQWTTHQYYNYDYLIYKKGNVLQYVKKTLMIFSINLRYRFLDLSKEIGIYHVLKKMKRNIYRIRFATSSMKYEWITPEIDIERDSQIHVFEDPEYDVIRRPVNDFLFQHKERLENIAVFSLKSHSNRYLIKGKDSSKVLLIK